MGGHGPILLGSAPVFADAPAGGDIVVEIDESAATGYVWQLRAEPAASVDVLDEVFAPGSPAPGASGRRRWTLRLRGGADVCLTAALKRPWEQDAPPAKIAIATIHVAP